MAGLVGWLAAGQGGEAGQVVGGDRRGVNLWSKECSGVNIA